MRKWAGAILRSKVAGFFLILTLTFSAIELGRKLWPAVAMKFAGTEPLVEPKLDSVEKVVREHIESVRAQCNSVVNNGNAQPRQKGLAYGQLGKIYLAYAYPEAAMPCFRNAARLDPGEFRWPYLLAEALERSGKTEESLRPMAQAVRLMQEDVTATPIDRTAGMCFLGRAAMRLNKTAEAKRTFQAVLDMAPGNAFALVKSGQLAAQEGDGAAALAFFQRALKQAPNQPILRQLLSAEYRRQGNVAKADEFAVGRPSEGRKIPPVGYRDPLAMQVSSLNRSGMQQNRRGLELIKVGRYKDALEYFRRSAEMNENSVPALINLGMTFLGLGRVEEAQRTLEKAQTLDPAAEGARAGLYLAYAEDSSTRNKAVEEAMEWHREKPDSIEALRALAVVSMRLQRFAEALKVFQEAEVKAPAESWPRLGEASALSELKQYRAALAKYIDLDTKNGDDSEVQLNYARFLAASPDASVRDGVHSLKISQKLLASQYSVVRAETVAVGLAETGHFQEAVDLQRKAVANCGDQAEITLRARADHVLRSLEAHRAWREPAPLTDVNDRR